jgi:hypothetical protein
LRLIATLNILLRRILLLWILLLWILLLRRIRLSSVLLIRVCGTWLLIRLGRRGRLLVILT